MTLAPPSIDSRTAPEIERQLVGLLETYAPEWKEADPATGRATGVSAGLIGVFARFAELTLQRLNRAPEKNELAFLDLIGAAPLPGQPARAPLTFALAAGARGAAVPARTQVAAPAGQDRPAPVVFETVRDLSLTPATLARVITWDALADRRSDHSRVADPRNDDAAILFRGDGPIEHVLYFGHEDLLGYPTITDFGLTIWLNAELPSPPDPRTVQWEIWDGADGIPLTPTSVDGGPADSTAALITTGSVGFGTIDQVPRTTVNGVTSRWLRCRLLTPITASAEPVAGFARAAHMPVISSGAFRGIGRAAPTLPDAAFSGAVPLDVSKDFLPFGADPKFGATWYLGSRAILSQKGRRIALSLTLTDPASGVPQWAASSDLTFRWEYFTDAGWTDLGTTTTHGSYPGTTSYLTDPGPVFTGSGEVSFVQQIEPRTTVVNGVENYWLRVRLIGGAFTPRGTTLPVAPSLARATLSFDSTNYALNYAGVEYVAGEDAITSASMQSWKGLQPLGFAPAPDPGRSLYLALAVPEGGIPLGRSRCGRTWRRSPRAPRPMRRWRRCGRSSAGAIGTAASGQGSPSPTRPAPSPDRARSA